jgi:hypothetical protein
MTEDCSNRRNTVARGSLPTGIGGESAVLIIVHRLRREDTMEQSKGTTFSFFCTKT